MTFLSNLSINRKITVATALAVATGIFVLVWLALLQTKNEISVLGKQNYATITDLIAKQASGAVRWRKVDLIKAVYRDIAEADDSVLAALTAFDAEGGELVNYQSNTLLPYNFASNMQSHGNELKEGKNLILETDQHQLVFVPVLAGKKKNFVGVIATAWSLHKIKEQIRSDQIQIITVGVIVLGVVLALLSYLLRIFVLKSLNRVIELAKDLAEGEGDLRKRIIVETNDEFSKLAHWINLFIERVHDIVSRVKISAGELNNEAITLLRVVEESNQSLEEQKRDVDQVATATNEMSATVTEVEKNAAQASMEAQETERTAYEGQNVVSENMQSIDALAKEVESASKVIDRLALDAESIGSVLDVIRGIAEQTNLLALNAAIEAARAGEQGRGFAVVADEVRTLASRTQQSTQEIQEMIERLQSGANQAVKVMKQGKEKAVKSVEQSAKVHETLSSITEMITKINDMNSQIATAAVQQSQVTEEINKSVNNVHTLFEKNIKGAQQSARSGNTVADLSESLQQLVSQFKV